MVSMFYCGRIIFNGFKQADIKSVMLRVTSAASLDDGHYEETIPAVKGHHVT